MLGKIAASILLHSPTHTSWPMVQSLLTDIAKILVLILIAAMLSGSLVLLVLYFFYTKLLAQGLETDVALGIIAVFILFLLGIIFMIAKSKMSNLREAPRTIMAKEAPLAYRISNVVNAFVEGILTHPKGPKRS